MVLGEKEACGKFPMTNKDSTLDLISGLLHGFSRQERFSCAVYLMTRTGPEVKAAYIHALNDPSDKVVQVSCMKLSHHGGEDVVAPMRRVLCHLSWNVRLEACKALIVLKAVDNEVVSTLEQMAQDSEAAEYDALCDQIDEIERSLGDVELTEEEKARWGKIGEITEQARQVAGEQEG